MTNKLLLKENLLNFEFFKLNDVIVRRFGDLAFRNRLFQDVITYSRPKPSPATYNRTGFGAILVELPIWVEQNCGLPPRINSLVGMLGIVALTAIPTTYGQAA